MSTYHFIIRHPGIVIDGISGRIDAIRTDADCESSLYRTRAGMTCCRIRQNSDADHNSNRSLTTSATRKSPTQTCVEYRHIGSRGLMSPGICPTTRKTCPSHPKSEVSDFEVFSGLNDNIRQLDGGSQLLTVFTGISFSGYPRTTIDYSLRSTVRDE